jgi:hypothetical protein
MNFPYQTGLEFVQTIFDHGGYKAVNAMFKNPPVDTRQILHPDDYPNVKPVTVKLPDLTTPLGGGYKLLDSGVLGEAGTIFLLSDGIDPQTRLPKNTARQAAMGWSGDAYAVYDNGSSSMPVLVLMTQWDSISDAQQFASAFKRYGTTRWGKSITTAATTVWTTSGAVASIAQNGQKTTWILAPDGNVLQRITSAIQ